MNKYCPDSFFVSRGCPSFAEKFDSQGWSEAENEVSLDWQILEHIIGQRGAKLAEKSKVASNQRYLEGSLKKNNPILYRIPQLGSEVA